MLYTFGEVTIREYTSHLLMSNVFGGVRDMANSKMEVLRRRALPLTFPKRCPSEDGRYIHG